MARLNDPPPSLEALDALKRRFTRQNRDLARTNSAQSLRIRNLETEISRLLSENISLRETAIASQKEAERWKVQHGLGEDVKVMKERLETKLKEVAVLVEELGGLPEKAARKGQRRKSRHGILGEARSPSEKEWRNRQTLAGVLSGAAEQEGRLPPIVEDKLYPRRTLEPLEIKGLVDAEDGGKESESPDLGPPPVAHFDVAEPIDFNKSSPEFGNGENEVVQHVNLETRRRRRTSSLLRDMTDSTAAEEAIEKSSLFKSGAKRKLDMSELEDNAAPATSGSENEEFVFQRRPALKPASNRNSSRFSRPSQAEIVIPNIASSPQKEKERKALALKSTNSPNKRAVLVEGSKADQPKRTDIARRTARATEPMNPAERPPSRTTASTAKAPPSTTRPTPSEPQQPPLNPDPTEMPPKTPFLPTSILSPPSTSTSSEPVTSAPSTSSRPSEFAIINSVEDVLNGSIGRGSRRARAAVSYAEPNLRDKMRRPGGKVGAVEGVDGRRKREDSLGEGMGRGMSEVANGDVDAGDRVRVKRQESLEEERWKGLPMAKASREREEPGSPLSDKNAQPTSARPIDNGPERDRANALKRHAQARQAQKARLEENEERALKDAVEKLSIFDGPASSPGAAAATATATGTGTAETESSRTRKGDAKDKEQPHPSTTVDPGRRKMNIGVIGREAGRRHSMMPASSSANVPPRPSSAASNRADRSQNPAGKMVNARDNGLGGLKRSTSMAVLKNQSHRSADVDAGAGTETGFGTATGTADLERSRSERMASRRRSMMV